MAKTIYYAKITNNHCSTIHPVFQGTSKQKMIKLAKAIMLGDHFPQVGNKSYCEVYSDEETVGEWFCEGPKPVARKYLS